MLYGRLLKALYGCVQASRLWFNKLTRVLHCKGYEHSPEDPCVMRWVVSKKVFLLLIYVDDILLLADDEEIDRLEKAFLDEFMWIAMERNNKLPYLGMLVTLEQGTATIDMTYLIEKLLESYKNLVTNPTQSNKSIFQVDGDAVILPEVERKVFPSLVTKLLYLSKCTRPDILTAVTFLCTRVMRVTLEYLLGYLQATRHEVLRLTPSGVLGLEAYMDAAFTPLADLHTGLAIFF